MTGTFLVKTAPYPNASDSFIVHEQVEHRRKLVFALNPIFLDGQARVTANVKYWQTEFLKRYFCRHARSLQPPPAEPRKNNPIPFEFPA